MTAAVVLFWAGGLCSAAQWLLWLVCRASPYRRLLVLATLALAAACAHTPEKT